MTATEFQIAPALQPLHAGGVHICLAERGGFEASTLHFRACFRALMCISLLREKTVVSRVVDVKVGRTDKRWHFPRTGCNPRNEQCVCPPGEGAGNG